MIIVIEGISASGKTSWCTRHAPQHLVPEQGRVEHAPDAAEDPVAAAFFWTELNVRRWKAALAMEAETGTAVCDTDPLKLHYSWCRWQIGVGTKAEWAEASAALRAAIDCGSIGFADRYFVRDLSPAQARLQKEQDLARSRRNFELHARMRRPLIAWYEALEAARPGSVEFRFPARLPDPVSSDERYGLAAFDRMMELLDAAGTRD